MAFLGLSISTRQVDSRTLSPNPLDDSVFYPLSFSSGQTGSGIYVTPETSMRLTAVYCAVNILSSAIGSLPLNVYEYTDEDSKKRLPKHPVHRILTRSPNGWQTAMEFRTMMAIHYLLRGNAYAKIFIDREGVISKLEPLNPDRVRITQSNKGLPDYHYRRLDGTEVTYQRWQMLHIRGLSSDGFYGMSPIEQCREAIGLACASEEYAARFYANDATPGGVLRHPETLDEEVHKRIKQSWKEAHAGSKKAHEIAILEEGMEFQPITLKPEDIQFMEARNYQVFEIARIFNLPPHMLKDLSRATFSNIENLDLGYVKHSLMPHLATFEQAFERDLLPRGKRDENPDDYKIDFDVDGMLRGDIKSRTFSYSVGIQNGWLSINDVRRKENLNPIPNGDVHFIPTNNMTPIDQAIKIAEKLANDGEDEEGKPKDDDGKEEDDMDGEEKEKKGAKNELKVFRMNNRINFHNSAKEILERAVAKEIAIINRELAKDTVIPLWSVNFFEEHRDYLKTRLRSVVCNFINQEVTVRLLSSEEFWITNPAAIAEVVLEKFSNRYRDENVAELSAKNCSCEEIITEWKDSKSHKYAAELISIVDELIEEDANE